MKNLIYMVAINHESSTYDNSDYSKYSIKSWECWCKNNNVDFMLITEHDDRLGKPIWNKELVFEKARGYDKIGIVDSDTMIKWDAPNVFEMYDDEFCGVIDNVNLKWVSDSLKVYGKFFDGVDVDIDEYINAGVLFFTKEHLPLFENILNFYLDNREELDNWNKGGGKEQTILNYHLKTIGFKRKFLDPSWNLLGMHKKQMFVHNWQLDEDNTPFFIKYGYIWHFTGFGIPDRINLMKKTWNLLEDNYNQNNTLSDKYDHILNFIKDRSEDASTTSRKFKYDLLDIFYNDNFKDKTVVEIGHHHGHSTKLLSKIFKKVVAVDNWHQDIAKKTCKDSDNIDFIKSNLYHYINPSDLFEITEEQQNTVDQYLEYCKKNPIEVGLTSEILEDNRKNGGKYAINILHLLVNCSKMKEHLEKIYGKKLSIQIPTKWEDILPTEVDVVFIDAGHTSSQVATDIYNALRLWPDVTFIFDDYGLPPGNVKVVIDDFVKDGILKINKFIGGGRDLKNSAGTPFISREGCICNFNGGEII